MFSNLKKTIDLNILNLIFILSTTWSSSYPYELFISLFLLVLKLKQPTVSTIFPSMAPALSPPSTSLLLC